MRKITMFTTVLGLAALAGAGATNAGAQIRVNLNGEPVRFMGTQPRSVDGRVMVPLRGVLEQMGATVDWIARSQTVIASKGGMELELPIGSRTATVNNKTVSLDVPAMTLAGSTMVPLRFVSEALGADVAWSSSTQTVAINTSGRIASNDREFYRGNRDNNRDRNYDQDRNNRNRRYSRMTTLSAGTVIPVRLDDELSSDSNRVGDRFTATIQSGRDDADLPTGTRFEGTVREAIPARSGKPGVLDVEFTKVIFPDGTERSIAGGVTSLDSKNISRDSNGHLVAKGSGRSDERMKWVGIGAGAGILLSTLTKGNILVDTLLGAGAGYLYNELQRKGASNVNIKSGTEVGVKLNKSLQFAAANP